MAGTAAAERVADVAVPGIRSPALIGREQELAALAQALAAGPAVVLVEGEAGIGKSRLVLEYLASPAGTRHRSLAAACPPFRQPFTLGPVVDALRQATGDVTGLRLSPLAGALRPLFPEWADGLPPAPEPLDDPSAARHRLFRALAELLERLGVAVLVAEDAHWADEATLEFLLFVASHQPLQSRRAEPGSGGSRGVAPPEPKQPSLVVTYRPEDVPRDSLLRRLTSRLPAGRIWERVTLGPLDVAATAELVASMLPGGQVSMQFADFLYGHTDGLPLAIEESVRLLRDRRDLRRRGGEWVRRSLGALAVPPTVRDAVIERTGRLGGEARAVLQGAAVLAGPADEPTLSAVAGLAAGQGRAGLAGAVGCGLLACDSRGLVSFRHVLAARAVYEAIPMAERQDMHRRACRALEVSSPLPVAQLARHSRAAGQTADWCRFAEQAADLALASGDEATAATLLHDLITNADLPAGTLAALARKIPLYALGRHAFSDDLARTLRSVLAAGAIPAAQQAEAGYQLGRILCHAGEFRAAVPELARAVPGLRHRPLEAMHAMLLLGNPSYSLWPAAVHRRWLNRASKLAAGTPMPASDRMKFTVFHATALLELGEEMGWTVAAELPGDATAPQYAQNVTAGRSNIGDAAVKWGRYPQARQQLAAALELAGRHNYPRIRAIVQINTAHLDWFDGTWTGLAGRAAALADLDDPMVSLDAVLITALLEAAQGAVQAAEKKLRHVLEEERRRGIVSLPLESAAALARLSLAGGRADEAIALTDEPMQVVTGKGIWVWATDIAPARVQALVAVGRHGEAAEIVTAFGRGLRGRNAPAARAAHALCRAILAQGQGQGQGQPGQGQPGQGQPGPAAALFGRAAAAWHALPRPYDALLAREQQGCCLLAAGQHEAGQAVLQDVFRELSALGASGDAERVVRLLRGQGVRVPRLWRHGRRGYGSELSPREREVVRLLVAGHTTQQIATELCRSPNTVSTQLHSAMRKLNVSSRAALAARAVEDGVLAAERFTTPSP
jgi:DNA-binding CsgD family transcriptional regulator/tetratricopeptide (TPR) repeat protein